MCFKANKQTKTCVTNLLVCENDNTLKAKTYHLKKTKKNNLSKMTDHKTSAYFT